MWHNEKLSIMSYAVILLSQPAMIAMSCLSVGANAVVCERLNSFCNLKPCPLAWALTTVRPWYPFKNKGLISSDLTLNSVRLWIPIKENWIIQFPLKFLMQSDVDIDLKSSLCKKRAFLLDPCPHWFFLYLIQSCLKQGFSRVFYIITAWINWL